MAKIKDVDLEVKIGDKAEKERIERFVERFLKCRRCGKRNSTYSSTREEMTCRHCGNMWKVREEEMQGEI